MEGPSKTRDEAVNNQSNYQAEDLHCREGSSMKQHKKDRLNARHSYHQAMGAMHGSKSLFNSIEYEEYRSLVSRERSFVRPRSKLVQAPPPTQIKEHPQQQQQQHQHQQKRKSVGMAANQRTKPALEIYRPPTLRGSSNFEANGDAYYNEKNYSMAYYDPTSPPINNNNNNNSTHFKQGSKHMKKPGLNIHAKEFISFHQGFSPIHHSSSSSNVYKNPGFPEGLKHSKSGKDIAARKLDATNSTTKVHFTEFPHNDPDSKVGMTHRTLQTENSTGLPGTSSINPIKRSKSLGSVDFSQTPSSSSSSSSSNSDDKHDALYRIGPFPQEVQKSILESINDPTKQNARQLMDAARHILSRAVESSKHSEPTAQICIKIIEKEKGETFLETLLNTCQEFFQKRDRILRNPQNASSHSGGVTSHPKWIAYMSFLSEIYTQLKRRQNQLMNQRMRNNETPPGLYILSLLAQCCYVCLQEPSINSLSETECFFFVLTAVGKDIEMKLPTLMSRVMSSTRDAFLKYVHVPSVRKTLLQLIEMHAARWNLSAPAVMYYYPGCATKLVSDIV